MHLRSIIRCLFTLKHTTQKLKETTRELNKFRLVFDQAPAAVYIINKNMRFEYINPSFTQQSGYTKDDLLHKHVNETIYKGKIPESRLHVVEALQRGDTWQGELLSTHKTGSTYWASTIASPYKNERNEVEGFIVIQQDITGHKRMQIALDESENFTAP
ncbi:MAG: PAS domain S-box protein [Bacteroidales bacterium]|nr:PAS domain S-box protein [Bacteroidales bacterium]